MLVKKKTDYLAEKKVMAAVTAAAMTTYKGTWAGRGQEK